MSENWLVVELDFFDVWTNVVRVVELLRQDAIGCQICVEICAQCRVMEITTHYRIVDEHRVELHSQELVDGVFWWQLA